MPKQNEFGINLGEGLATQLLDAAPDPTVIVDQRGHIVYANSRVAEVLGYAPTELIGQTVEILLPEEVRANHPHHRDGFFNQPRARAMGGALELHARKKDGVTIPVEISLSPVKTAHGTLVSSSIRDISSQKLLAQDLAQANRAKSRFLAAASHDLRQPIQTLNLLNKTAAKLATDETLQGIIEKQQKGLNWMSNLLNSLLDISKLEAGVVKPDIDSHSVQDIFETLNATFEAQALDKGLKFFVEESNARINTDYKLLTQIMENFVSNAIRYTKAGFIKIHAAVEAQTVRLAVTDTGIGIPGNEIGSIFEEFHQTEQSSRTEGLGLGLSIVQRTADLLGCNVGVESIVGHGSSFYIDLPKSESSIDAGSQSEQQNAQAFLGGHILVVDDEPDIVEATCMLLDIEGYKTSSATSLGTLRSCLMNLDSPPDLIVSDFHLLDNETGIQVIETVRKTTREFIPGIILSGDTSNQAYLTDIDAVTFLSKPVDVDELLAAIHKVLQSQAIAKGK